MNELLRFFSEKQPRRIRVIENTLKSRRTVSTLFWAKQYGILTWTGAFRKLEREQFDRSLDELLQNGLIRIDEKEQALLTTAGVLEQEEMIDHSYQPSFFEWYWLANTNQIESRLYFAIQVISELAYHNRYYAPLTNDYREQQFIKNWLHTYPGDLIKEMIKELEILGDSLASVDQRLANYFFYSLIGYHEAGMTVTDFKRLFSLDDFDVQVLKHDALLAVTAFSRSYHGALSQLLENLIASSPLSLSSQRTTDLYRQGRSISEIARYRRLRESTVREHLLESAIISPKLLDWQRLLPTEVRQHLANYYQGDSSSWRFDAEHVPGGDAAFFYYRLFQIYQQEQEND